MLLRSRSSVATNREPPPLKKKKKVSQILPHTTTISSLPDDLVLICLARVSRLYYPTLSVVSKRFRSLIASPELYKVRSLLGCTESCIYACFWNLNEPNCRWFALYKRPDNGTTKTKKKNKKNRSGYLFVPIPSPHSVPFCGSKFVSNGAEIYVIGGTNDGDIMAPSSSVWILDCRTHTWHKAPNMKVARTDASAKAIDGKVYVAGGCEDMNSSNFIEFLDPKTQTWNSVDETRSVVSEYELSSDCVVDNVACYYFDGKLRWYEKDGNFRVSRIIKGLKGLPKFNRPSDDVRLVNYNGKMAIFWEKHDRRCISKDSVYWCVVIALERRSSEEIWGTVEWFDTLLKVPEDHSLKCVLATTL